MNKILDFIEDHKYGIIIALIVHVAVFIYFQVDTYEEKVVYDPWEFRGKNIESPDDIEITPDQIETPEEQELLDDYEPEEIANFVKDANDSRETSSDEAFYTSYEGDAYDNVKDFESEVIEKLQEGRESQDSKSSDETDLDDGKESNQNNESSKESQQASDKAYEGKTMVRFDLASRHPHNKNDWHIRNPGYTCGNVNGIVVVDIKVAESGNVTSAKYNASKSRNADACMIRQAEKYALLSRFNYDPNSAKSQEGWIEYKFVYRKK